MRNPFTAKRDAKLNVLAVHLMAVEAELAEAQNMLKMLTGGPGRVVCENRVPDGMVPGDVPGGMYI